MKAVIKIINKIIQKPEKIFYAFQRMGLMNWMSDEQYIKFSYRMIFGRSLNLENPKAYTEKLAWCKLNWRCDLATRCADKFSVRSYIYEKLGQDADKYLNEIYGVWNNFEEIDFGKLPKKFVIKPTNGTGDVVICKDKDNFDYKKAKRKLLTNSKRSFSNLTKEWVYYDIPQRFLVEEFIETDDEDGIKDYKFFCFHGEPKFLYVCSERNVEPKFNFYDLDWNEIAVRSGYSRGKKIQKPKMFSEMIKLAEHLSKDFAHVRVDFFQENDRIYIGELTFFHMGGFTKFEPDEYDYIFGKYFCLDKINADEIVLK